MGTLIDLTGRTFGRLKVVARAGSKRRPNRTDAQWLCECKCGAEIVVLGLNLLHHNTQSCGCIRREASSQRMKAMNERKWRHEHKPTAAPERGAQAGIHQ